MRDRYSTNQRRARRRKAKIHAPTFGQPEAWLKHFAHSIDTFSGLDAAARIELAWGLNQAAWNVSLNASTLDLNKNERRVIKTIYAKLDRMRRRNPAIDHAAGLLKPLTVQRRKSPEGHTILLNGIFETYFKMRNKYPECVAPGIDQFVNAVLADLHLGQIDDEDLIGDEDFRAALQRWEDSRAALKRRLD
jgi:hypothetical protein